MATIKTDRKPLFGNLRSHACNAVRHAQKLNKQKVNINGTTVILSTRELRTLKKASQVKIAE